MKIRHKSMKAPPRRAYAARYRIVGGRVVRNAAPSTVVANVGLPDFAPERAELAARLYKELSPPVSARRASEIAREILDGMDNELDTDAIAQNILDIAPSFGEARARAIAETETARIDRQGQLDVLDDKTDGEATVRWKAAAGACPYCIDHAGEEYALDEAEGVLPAHPHCVVGDSVIHADDVNAVFKAHYSGEIVEFSTARGRRLSVTANHILLTEYGFIPARLIDEGTHVIDAASIYGLFFATPNGHDRKPGVADVWAALVEQPDVLVRKVPTAAEYLHGDGAVCDGEIEIIRADSKLRNQLEKRRGEVVERSFMSFKFGRVGQSLPTIGSVSHLLKRVASAASRHMRCCRDALALVNGRALPSKSLRLTATAGGSSSLLQSTTDCTTGAAILASDGEDRRPFVKELDHLLRRHGKTIILDRITSAVHRHVKNLPVYDLETQSSLYAVNGLISSNCHCRWQRVRGTANMFCPTGPGGGVDPSCGGRSERGQQRDLKRDEIVKLSEWRESLWNRGTVTRLTMKTVPGGELEKYHPGAITVYRGRPPGSRAASDVKGSSWTKSRAVAERWAEGGKVEELTLTKDIPALDLGKALRGIPSKSEHEEEVFVVRRSVTANMFCPTGPGGGVDPSCGRSDPGARVRDIYDRSGREHATMTLADIDAAVDALKPLPKKDLIGVLAKMEIYGLDRASKAKQLQRIKQKILDRRGSSQREAMMGLDDVGNMFCPTGPGGGVDPSCGVKDKTIRKVLHGTTSTNLESILRHGITASRGARVHGGSLLYEGGRGKSVYVTTSEDSADIWATATMQRSFTIATQTSKPVILEVHVPKKLLKKDELSGGDYRIEGEIKPEWIKGVRVRIAADYVTTTLADLKAKGIITSPPPPTTGNEEYVVIYVGVLVPGNLLAGGGDDAGVVANSFFAACARDEHGYCLPGTGGLASRVASVVRRHAVARYHKLEARYGKAGALAVMAGIAATLPAPVPGSSFAVIGVAEGIRAAHHLAQRYARHHARVANMFCPTGEGGGIDPSCGRDGASGPSSAIDWSNVEVPSHDSWRDLAPDPNYAYHATNLERAQEVSSTRLKPHGPSYGTDQSTWPDGSTDKRIYFIDKPASAWSFAPEEGKPALLRVARSAVKFKKESTGDLYVTKSVSAGSVEILTTEGWKSITRPTANVFCPTGPGGGVDPSCSPGGGKSEVERLQDKVKAEQQARFGVTDTEGKFKVGGVWTPERVAAVHTPAIEKMLKDVPRVEGRPTLYMTGGGYGSGKSTLLEKFPEAVGFPKHGAAVVADPDALKREIPEFVQMASGPTPDKNAASFVHEESSYLAKEGVVKGLLSDRNVIYDTSGDTTPEKLEAKVEGFRLAGATRVEAHYAFPGSIAEAQRRADSRAAKSEGGLRRYVPKDALAANHAEVARCWLRSADRGTFDKLGLWGTVGKFGDPPVLIAMAERGKATVIHDAALFAEFRKIGGG